MDDTALAMDRPMRYTSDVYGVGRGATRVGRPFYEQYFYNRRPRDAGGEVYLAQYVNDWTNWYSEQLAETETILPGSDWMTAKSALPWKELRRRVKAGVGGYLRKNGTWPDFCTPRSFGGMNLLHSLTMPMPRKIPADKLAVGDYIPEKYAAICRPARVFGSWDIPRDITFAGIPPGHYYFKSNHASAHVIKLQLPCPDVITKLMRAQAFKWLKTDYGAQSSQWWYSQIERRVFLEEDLNAGGAGPLTDFRFHVINGKVVVLQMDVGLHTEERHNPVYDRALNYMPYDFLRQNLREEPLPAKADVARDIAEAIGSKFQYCRVDLYLRGDEIFLGELTFLPNAGRRRVRSPELDEIICDAWDPMPRITRISPMKEAA